jgi:hypothetical protein
MIGLPVESAIMPEIHNPYGYPEHANVTSKAGLFSGKPSIEWAYVELFGRSKSGVWVTKTNPPKEE